MSAHMHFSFWVDRTLLKMILPILRSAVDVVTTWGKLVRFPPTVSQVRCVSDFCAHISAKVLI